MKINELPHCPKWLAEATTEGADVEWVNDRVIWRDGEWHDGEWRGGEWRGGEWHDGVWYDGVWRGGEWHDGEWRGGEWRGGEWRGRENRLQYMAGLLGIVFQNGTAVGYRTTRHDGRGRFTMEFTQPEGEWYDPDALPAGSGVCCAGIHVTSAARAWTYFGVDPTCQFWRVEFTPDNLLDCDGEKARIRGGIFTKIPRPF